MSGSFWAKKIGVQPQQQQPAQPQAPGAWWQTPASVPVNPGTPPPGYGHPGSGMEQYTMAQLKGMRADQMSQEQMEQLASLELQGDKYNHHCENCGSDDFIPAGTRINNQRMPVDKCFHCGSQGGVTGSPEPAVGGSTGKRGHATRQVGNGGGSYGQHVSQLPSGMIPRGA